MGDVHLDFEEFVRTAGPRLQRSAWLLTHDAGQAEDLTQLALIATWRAWAGLENPHAYAQTVLARRFVSATRRRWRAEQPTQALPEEARDDEAPTWTDHVQLLVALQRLPRMQRAVIVLRFFLTYRSSRPPPPSTCTQAPSSRTAPAHSPPCESAPPWPNGARSHDASPPRRPGQRAWAGGGHRPQLRRGGRTAAYDAPPLGRPAAVAGG